MPQPALDSSGNYTERVNSPGAATTVAATGTVIANAATIPSNVDTVIVTGATGATGVILPTASLGKTIKLANIVGNALLVYPPVNSTINGGSANAAVDVENLSLAVFVGTNATNWQAMFTANA